MRRLTILAVLAAVAGPPDAMAARPQSTAGKPVFTYPIEKTVLENGLTVLSVPFDSPGIIAYYTVVRTGSRNEVEKGLSGFAHFFEHMMFRGTERYTQEKYNDVLKSLGADSNAFTTDDMTCYHMTIPATALATAVEIEADRFQNLKIRRAVVSEGSACGPWRIQQECVVAVFKAQRNDARLCLLGPYLQAHDDRLP